MTAQKMSKTVVAGTTAAAFDVNAELGSRERLEWVVVTNRSANEVGVDVTGGTAVLDQDDTLHVLAGASRPVPYPVNGSMSIVASAAGTKVEVASDRRGLVFMR